MEKRQETGSSELQRVNRILSLAGLTSRRKADEWIRAGRVAVNGKVLTEVGAKAVWGLDSIKVDGREIPGYRKRIYLMLNKPFGYMTTLSDPENRPLATDLLKGVSQRVHPVGRLDFDSLGLLMFTNDGEWTYRLTHPRYRVPRTYKVTAEGNVGQGAITALTRGVRLDDGPSGRSKIALIAGNDRQTILRITITHGKPRQVRRMLESVGHRVIQLMRIGYGALVLGDLKVGRYRHLETDEIESMKKLVGLHL